MCASDQSAVVQADTCSADLRAEWWSTAGRRGNLRKMRSFRGTAATALQRDRMRKRGRERKTEGMTEGKREERGRSGGGEMVWPAKVVERRG